MIFNSQTSRITSNQLSNHSFVVEADQGPLQRFAMERLRVGTRRNSESSASSSVPSGHVTRQGTIVAASEREPVSDFFPLCEDCFWIPERLPWSEEFIAGGDGMAFPILLCVCVVFFFFLSFFSSTPPLILLHEPIDAQKDGPSAAVIAAVAAATSSPLEDFSDRAAATRRSLGSGKSSHIKWTPQIVSPTRGPTTVELLFKLMRNPETGVALSSRYHRFRRFKDVFVAADAVTWIMKECGISSRTDALMIAQELLRRQFIQNVVDQSTLFNDSKTTFYRFCAPVSAETGRVDDKGLEQQPKTAVEMMEAILSLNSLTKLRSRAFENVGFLGRTYCDCVLGSDVADLIVNDLNLSDRSVGVQVAQQLLMAGHILPALPSSIPSPFALNNLYRLNKAVGAVAFL